MINRELTKREREILGMIRPTTFQDIVDVVRRDVEQSRYDAKRELRHLHNGVTNGRDENNIGIFDQQKINQDIEGINGHISCYDGR